MGRKKLKIQTLIFDKNNFPNRRIIKNWIIKHNYRIDNRLKEPILKQNKNFRVRQRNPDWFIKKTFRLKKIANGINGVFGFLKN